MKKNWNIKKNSNEETVRNLQEILKVDRIIASLLYQRKITGFDEAKSFFRPDLNELHNPFLMRDMDKAIERIQKALDENQKILIFGMETNPTLASCKNRNYIRYKSFFLTPIQSR